MAHFISKLLHKSSSLKWSTLYYQFESWYFYLLALFSSDLFSRIENISILSFKTNNTIIFEVGNSQLVGLKCVTITAYKHQINLKNMISQLKIYFFSKPKKNLTKIQSFSGIWFTVVQSKIKGIKMFKVGSFTRWIQGAVPTRFLQALWLIQIMINSPFYS